MSDKKALWDKKASTFARYSEELNSIQKGVFEALRRWEVDFSAQSLIDIGCGTGVWTLHLAKVAKSVVALDSSQAMLEVFKEDAKRLNLSNVSCVNSNFEAFYQGLWANKDEKHETRAKNDDKNARSAQSRKRGEKFDIAFVSMSPALNKNEDYKAFAKLAPLRVFVGWEEYRQSDFLAPIFKAFGVKQKSCYTDEIENFLRQNGVKFKKEVFEEIRYNEKPRQIAIEGALWHLNMAGVERSAQEVGKLVTSQTIKEVIKSKIKLLVF